MQNLTKIALKLLAIYWLVSSIIAIPQLIGTYFTLRNQNVVIDGLGWLFFVAITIGLAIFTGLILWKVANSTSNNLAALPDSEGSHLSLQTVEKGVILGVGLIFLGWSVPSLPQSAYELWRVSDLISVYAELPENQVSWVFELCLSILSNLIILLLGLVLVFARNRTYQVLAGGHRVEE